jgi:enoyl-CoA hydratase/carnithine racemase
MENSNWILSVRQGPVLELTINRPERKNALNLAMYQTLADQLRQAAVDGAVRAVVITGAGGCFTAGNDLEDFAQGERAVQPDAPLPQFMEALFTFPKPVLAAVDGVAVGIGTTLLLHCDLIFASPASEFRLPFAKLGLCPEFASSRLLPRLVGHAKASEWLLLGKPFGADEALAAGLINQMADDPLTLARDRAQQLALMAPSALRNTKALLREPQVEELRAAMVQEARIFIESLRGPEFAEAVAAFFAKRPPDFSRFE